MKADYRVKSTAMPDAPQYPKFSPQTEIILNSIADGVFTVDVEWRITYFNRAAEEITGVPASEAIGRPCCEVFQTNACETGCVLKHTLETQKPVVNRPNSIIRANGMEIPISVSTALLRDESGRTIGGVETFRDLSLVETLRREIDRKFLFGDIVSKSPAMQRVLSILPDVAQSDSTVLIQGESGTGKELLSRAVHTLSSRDKGPFVAINCGASRCAPGIRTLRSRRRSLHGCKKKTARGASPWQKKGLFSSMRSATSPRHSYPSFKGPRGALL